MTRHPIYFVVCSGCDLVVPAVKRDGWIEPPDGWGAVYPDCCGMRFERYVCSSEFCPNLVIRTMFAAHVEANRLFARALGPVEVGEPKRLVYYREHGRFRREVIETG